MEIHITRGVTPLNSPGTIADRTMGSEDEAPLEQQAPVTVKVRVRVRLKVRVRGMYDFPEEDEFPRSLSQSNPITHPELNSRAINRP